MKLAWTRATAVAVFFLPNTDTELTIFADCRSKLRKSREIVDLQHQELTRTSAWDPLLGALANCAPQAVMRQKTLRAGIVTCVLNLGAWTIALEFRTPSD